MGRDRTAMGILLAEVKSIEDYWVRLESTLEICMLYLQDKHEYGTSSMCSERGVQTAVAYSAERIARKEGLNPRMTKCLCMAVGLCFPEFGSYGMAACADYFIRNQIPWDLTEIKIGAIERCLWRASATITPELDEALRAYYENRTDIPEVNVVRYCQTAAGESRELMKNGTRAGEAISRVMDRAEKDFSVEKSLRIPDTPVPVVPAEVQEEADRTLDEFIAYDGLPGGVFDFFA